MKENTKRLLVWLYSTTQEPRFIKKSEVLSLLTDLSSAGAQSLLYLLEKKHYLQVQEFAGSLHYSLTQHGSYSIEAEFPALSLDRWQWQGDWLNLVCLTAPKTDKNFRYFRELMITHHVVGLTRGVFLFPGKSLPAALQTALETVYANAVVVMKAPQWVWGDERSIIGQKTNLSALMNVYSGISSEADRLIADLKPIKERDNQSKVAIVSLFNRLYAALESDFGLGKRYFPQVKFGRELLAELQLFG